jgi:hypothetical protein
MPFAEEAVRRRQQSKAGQIDHRKMSVNMEVEHFLVDKNLFLKWCSGIGVPHPKTVKVKRGSKLPGFHFQYPVVLKEANGPAQFLCHTKAEILAHAQECKDGYQVQEHLLGFDFYHLGRDHVGLTARKKTHQDGKVRYVEENDSRLMARLSGVTRRLRETLAALGINVFTLTIAVRQETIYIISCRPHVTVN